MSYIIVLNKGKRRIEPCGTPDKIPSQELKKESTSMLQYLNALNKSVSKATPPTVFKNTEDSCH